MKKRNFEQKKKERSGSMENALYKSVDQNGRKTELLNFRLNGRKKQCSKCFADTDYLSKDKLCADCEQQAEFVWREILTPLQRAEFLRGAAV